MKKSLMILLAGLSLAGCDSFYQSQQQAPKDLLRLNNPSLNTAISVQTVQERHAGELLAVQVVLHNDSRLHQNLRYRFLWEDASGFNPTPDGAGWQPLSLEGNASATVTGTSPTATTNHYHLEIGDQ